MIDSALALNILKSENPLIRFNDLGDRRIKMDVPVITCTGADVETTFNIPYMCSLEKSEIKHTNSANADSSNALTYSMSHRHYPNLWILVLAITGSTASDIIDEYENYYYEKGEFKIISNTTNTELLYISVYIKLIGV